MRDNPCCGQVLPEGAEGCPLLLLQLVLQLLRDGNGAVLEAFPRCCRVQAWAVAPLLLCCRRQAAFQLSLERLHP
jgi:hypothetical protein